MVIVGVEDACKWRRCGGLSGIVWMERGARQGVLGPSLSPIFINDLLYCFRFCLEEFEVCVSIFCRSF